MTAKALMAALGIGPSPRCSGGSTSWSGWGCSSPSGKGTKNDPRVWRVVEPGEGPGQLEEAAG